MTHLANIANPIMTVDVCILHGEDALFFRRSRDKKVFPGVLALPGGHIEAGEDPLAAAIREVGEETGFRIPSKAMRLRYIATHLHEDRSELYIVFGFLAVISDKTGEARVHDEGKPEWISVKEIAGRQDIFPPVRHYLSHLLGTASGILYNYSVWRNAELVRVESETVDAGAAG